MLIINSNNLYMTTQIFKVYADSKMGIINQTDVNFFEIFRDIGLKKNYTIGIPLTLFQDQEDGKITLPKGMWDFTIETNSTTRDFQGSTPYQIKLNIKNHVNGKEINDKSEPSIMGFTKNMYYTSTFRLPLTEDMNTFKIMIKPSITLNEIPHKDCVIDFQKITFIGTKIADLL